MPFDPFKHHRRSIRLQGYDYTQPGAYFITINTAQRLSIFGEIDDGIVRLNAFGEFARAEWMRTPAIRGEIALDEFIVMPDHFHAIVNFVECGNGLVRATGRSPTRMDGRAPIRMDGHDKPTISHGNVRATGRSPLRPGMPRGPANKSLASLIAGYKSAVTARINQLRGTPGAPVWQRNYHEHIIRNADELSRIREYIRNNPAAWETDDECPDR